VSPLARLRSGLQRGADRLDLRELWQRGAARWLPAIVVLAVAAALLLVYQSRFAGRAEVSAQGLQRGRLELARLRSDHRHLEGDLTRVKANRQHVDEFYGQRLSTESQRLTKVIAEVKDLARRCGLEPQAISYPEQPIEDSGLRKRSFVFGVEGTYADLRKLVNLLELSDSFLTLERVNLSGSGDRAARLRIELTLSTLFETAETAAATAAAAPAMSAPQPPVEPPQGSATPAPPAGGGAEVGG
jgi:Tfp pilus assembly protein PilO